MNKRLLALPIAAIFCAFNSSAQEGMYADIAPWSQSPVLHTLPDSYKKESAVYILDSRTFHFKFEGKNLVQLNHVYRLIKVEDDKGIEMFNKIYLQFSKYAEIYDIKARVITSSGKVINVPADKIKEEEEDGRRYKLFAMEGLEKGAEIEYSYMVKKDPAFFGSEIFQSKSVPYYQAKLLIITPTHLKFDARGYNGFRFLKDSVIGEERRIPGYSENIRELNDEKYGFRDPYLQRGDFKLSYNLSTNGGVEMNTWKEFAHKAYSNITNTSEKERRAVSKFVRDANVPSDASEQKTIMLLEDYMKSRINVDDKLVSDRRMDLEAMIKTGNTNDFGAVRLFVAMLENKTVKFQIVFPSVRNQLPLDEKLANWNRVDETMIYFPGTGKLVQPGASSLRYPFVEPYWAGTRGLFLKSTVIGDVQTAVGRFDDVPIEPFEQNAHNLELHARLDPSGDSLIIDVRQILKGYAAVAYRPIWTYLDKEKQEETLKEIIQSVAKSQNIENIKSENTGLTDTWDNKPLIISGTIHTAELLERAGKKLLFKLGELLGNQVQMYQEEKRRLPAELAYGHVLERKITFEIPAGYVIRNLDDINIDVQHKKEGVVTMGFVSSYKVVDKVLEVYIQETYRDLLYPLEEFEVFKKVINAAADFNKIVLILEKG